MTTPAMTWNVNEVMDDVALRDGPMIVMWGQSEWIEPSVPLPALPLGALPKRTLRQRLWRVRPWRIDYRLKPTPGQTLNEFGRAIADQFGVNLLAAPGPDDKAIWLIAGTWARNAPGAISSAGLLLKAMEDIQVVAVQVRVTCL